MSKMIPIDLKRKVFHPSSVILTDISPSNQVVQALDSPIGQNKICSICLKNFSSYCCPTCFAPYCSSTCYRNHDNRCTELFYKRKVDEQVEMEKWNGLHFESQENIKAIDNINEMLDRNGQMEEMSEENEEDEDLDEERRDLAEKLQSHSLDTTILTQKEKLKVDSLVNSRKNLMKSLIMNKRHRKDWKAWFDNGENEQLNNYHVPETPPYRWSGPCSDILTQTLSALFKIKQRKSFPVMKEEHIYHILSIFFTYIILIRQFQEEYHSQSLEFTKNFILLSGLLDTSYRPQSIFDIITRYSHKSITIPGIKPLNSQKLENILKDIQKLIVIPGYARYVVLDCWFICYQSVFSTFNNLSITELINQVIEYYPLFTSPLKNSNKNQVELISRKLYFFLLLSFDSLNSVSAMNRGDRFSTFMNILNDKISEYYTTAFL